MSTDPPCPTSTPPSASARPAVPPALETSVVLHYLEHARLSDNDIERKLDRLHEDQLRIERKVDQILATMPKAGSMTADEEKAVEKQLQKTTDKLNVAASA